MTKVLIEMTEKQHQMMCDFLAEAIPETWPEGFDSAREWFWEKNEYEIAERGFIAFRDNVYKKEQQ